MKNKFYRGKYLIAFYDSDDCCRYVFDNPKEIAEFQQVSVVNVYSRLFKIENNIQNTFKINGVKMKIHLIDVERDV